MKNAPESAPEDGFAVAAGSRYGTEHGLLSNYLRRQKSSALPVDSVKVEKPVQLALLCAAMERLEFQKRKGNINTALADLIKKLAGRKLPYTQEALAWNISYASSILAPKNPDNVQIEELDSPIPGVVPALLDQIDAQACQKPISKDLLKALQQLHAAIKPMEFWAGNKKSVQRLEAILAQKPAGVPDAGESWAEAIRHDIEHMARKRREKWLALLQNAPKGTCAKPTAQWKKRADELLADLGHEEFAREIEKWFGLVGLRATARIQPRNATLLRSLVWYASLLSGETVCRALANAVEGGLRKLSGGSLYASSISKACITALESMPGLDPVAQLSRLKHRVKSPWGLEEIEKAFDSAVGRSGFSRSEVEEVSLPTFGLDQHGSLLRQIGEHRVVLAIAGTHEVALNWLDSAGKALAKKPSLSRPEAEEEKAVKQLARDIERMLGAQRDRIENFLERNRLWAFETWKARYLEHPLLANLTRRLIWQFSEGNQTASAIWRDGEFFQVNGEQLRWLGSKTEVRMWHPLGVEAGQVQAWRRWLEDHEVSQPFKQAHREIYILTDAELATRSYSNRFAAHILRQHQFKALCEQRGWKSQFVGSWDSADATPTRDLPDWGLRAEYWIEAAGDGFAASGVALHVASDQLRFVNSAGEVVELQSVPPLVLSEVMRDVDLFVSVCSLGNDPTWNDGGPEGRYRDYWQSYSFGDLNATAKTRKDVLQKLLPRLKIAAKCSFSEKFLVVRGSLRTYKIHLGSGNILMEPNDRYLCIVPKQGGSQEDVFLPFEGDRTLSVILSKAFLLADDLKIKESNIVSQIRGG